MSKKVKTKAICVIGMHRSGTSAITRALKVFGVNLGDNLMPAVPGNNEKGFWEDVDLNKLNIELLEFLSHDWHTLMPITNDELKNDRIGDFKIRALELLREKTKTLDVFGIKDPRVARLLPFWRSVFDHLGFNVSYIIAIRNPLSVAKSLGTRDKFAEEKSYYLWLEHVLPSILETMGSPRVVVDYDRLIDKPNAELLRIAKSLGLENKINIDELRKYEEEFLEEGLRHSRYKPEDLMINPAVPMIVAEVYEALLQVAHDTLAIDSAEVQNCLARASVHLKEIYPALRYMTRQDSKIANLSQGVTKLEGQIASFDALVQERTAWAQSLDKELKEQTALMQERTAWAQSLDKELQERTAWAQSLDKELQERTAWAQSLEKELQERIAIIRILEEKATNMESALKEKDAALNKIYESHGWKALLKYYRIRSKLFPQNSKREVFAKFIFHLFLYIKNLSKAASGKELIEVADSLEVDSQNSEKILREPEAVHQFITEYRLSPAKVDNLVAIQGDLFDKTRMRLVQDSRKGDARNAVFMPCGAGSIHEQWLVSRDRSWDLVVYCYDDTYVDSIQADMVYGKAGLFNGTKFTAFARLINDNPDFLARYNYWMLMDNDILTTMNDVTKLFEIMGKYNLDIAQPSLTEDSFCAWPILKQKNDSTLRYVNAVEIMSFMFSKRALAEGIHLFHQAVSGYGIDLALSEIVRKRLGTKPAVIDAVAVKHTKEIDQLSGKFYTVLRNSSISPLEELYHMQRLYKLDVNFYEI